MGELRMAGLNCISCNKVYPPERMLDAAYCSQKCKENARRYWERKHGKVDTEALARSVAEKIYEKGAG